ncbi:L2 mu:pX:11K [Fowl aviadenovirus A]|uniref:L2 mu:pX:11K n=1 Tax=Fowl aviadenovirus A TaxID=190061 RepID=A0A3Q8Q6P3_9ADEN|nr:L2 mu:pX:11K [Fowl aviadenovirus A]QNH85935.1 L2 mu:pX:11K [Fowl aviadenovirus A]
MCAVAIHRSDVVMPSVLLTGGRTAKGKKRASRRRVKVPKLPKGARRKRASVTPVPTVATATASERAALTNLARRLQRGDYAAWRPADYTSPAVSEAARAAASSGSPATARDLATGTLARAVPMTGTGGRRRKRTATRRRSLKGGFLPALIPIIAAAIGAIPGIAGTAVGIANLKEQQRQFNKIYGDKK